MARLSIQNHFIIAIIIIIIIIVYDDHFGQSLSILPSSTLSKSSTIKNNDTILLSSKLSNHNHNHNGHTIMSMFSKLPLASSLSMPVSSSPSSSIHSNESWINNFHTNKTCTTTSDCPEDSSINQYHYKCDLELNQCVCNGLSYYCNQSTTTTNNNNANRKNYHNNDNQTFLSNNRLNDLVRRMPMLPISIVLISMFISICIVLQLFAKARFRNTQRSIFANPQKLELAKAQERRLSQLSQLSGQQQQWSSDRGMIYSLNHHKYPRLSLPQAPISLSSSSSSSMFNHRSVRNSLGSTNIVPTAMIGSTLTYPTPMFGNSITALSSSSSTSSSSSSKSSKNMMKQKQGTINVNLQ